MHRSRHRASHGSSLPKSTSFSPLGFEDGKIKVLVCALENKTRASRMQNMLAEFPRKHMTIEIIDDDTLHNKPVSEWPLCDAILGFFSSGFPLDKAIDYVALRKPYCLNNLPSQKIFFDRLKVFQVLKEHDIPVPEHLICDRQPGMPDPIEKEEDDYIIIGGQRLNKPFVEKPLSGEDHNINIYYAQSAGGGCKRLFRKVGNVSAVFDPDCNAVRRDKGYVYEKFLSTMGTDIKVYTVGPTYMHSEARKSPVVDGVVIVRSACPCANFPLQRDRSGKETRFPIILNAKEKIIARKVSLAFDQAVCGFDFLRTDGASFVCDVNGWSLVKKSKKFYTDCALLLHDKILRALAPHLLRLSAEVNRAPLLRQITPSSLTPPPGESEELRCCIGVFRHGDRTPKQKMKMRTCLRQFLDLYDEFSKKPPPAQAKLKSALALQKCLDVTRSLLEEHDVAEKESAMDEEEMEIAEVLHQLKQMKAVLERGGRFDGINRKVQLKPLTVGHREWDDDPSEKVVEILLVLKWGGALTHTGQRQAGDLGAQFRVNMYPGGDGRGLLRLHSTYRHDLKIYSSDEGRVQMTAAAFIKQFLALEGSLTPILVSLVRQDQASTEMLDDSTAATKHMEAVKDHLHEAINSYERIFRNRGAESPEADPGEISSSAVDVQTMPEPQLMQFMSRDLAPLAAQSLVRAVKKIGNVFAYLSRCRDLVKEVLDGLEGKISEVPRAVPRLSPTARLSRTRPEVEETISTEGTVATATPRLGRQSSSRETGVLFKCMGEGPFLLKERWKKLYRDFFKSSKKKFDYSKIPDIYDCIKFDILHNWKVFREFKGALELFENARRLSELIVPQEYGMTRAEKLDIARNIGYNLGRKIMMDMLNTMVRAGGDGALTKAKQTETVNLHEPFFELDTTADSGTMSDIATGEFMSKKAMRTRLYFTSESHIHSLVNFLRYSEPARMQKILSKTGYRLLEGIPEFDYLSHVVFRLLQRRTTVDCQGGEPPNWLVEIFFSPGSHGADIDTALVEEQHGFPMTQLQPIHRKGLTLKEFVAVMESMSKVAAETPSRTSSFRKRLPSLLFRKSSQTGAVVDGVSAESISEAAWTAKRVSTLSTRSLERSLGTALGQAQTETPACEKRSLSSPEPLQL